MIPQKVTEMPGLIRVDSKDNPDVAMLDGPVHLDGYGMFLPASDFMLIAKIDDDNGRMMHGTMTMAMPNGLGLAVACSPSCCGNSPDR